MEEPENTAGVVVILFVIFVALICFCVSLMVAAGCDVAQDVRLDMTAEPYIQCRGPKDAGKLVWWDGRFEPVPFPQRWGVRYKCVDHGKDEDGWWFEAIPEKREMP